MTPDIESLIRHRHVQLDQVRLHIVEAGPDHGFPVVLLHGFPLNWSAWAHQLAALAEAGWHVIAPDLRGTNQSDKPSPVQAYTPQRLAEDIQELLEALHIDQTALIGHGIGGLVGWQFAMHYPHWLSQLIVINAVHPGYFAEMLYNPRHLWRMRHILAIQLPEVPERALLREKLSPFRQALLDGGLADDDVSRFVAALERSGPPTGVLNYFRAIRQSGLHRGQGLRPIQTPTFVIWGKDDPYVGPEYAEPPAKWVWNVRCCWLDGVNHWGHITAPERINPLLLEALQTTAS